MCKQEVIAEYLAAGKRLTPLDGKVPLLKNWTEKQLSDKKVLLHDGNLGFVLGDTDLVVDVDPKNGGEDSFKKLLVDLDIELEPTVVTPSGGFHCYLSCPGGMSLKKTVKTYPGIDFLSVGSQCVIVSSTISGKRYSWSDDDLGAFYQEEAPQELLDMLDKDQLETPAGQEDLGDFEGLIGNSTMPAEKVLSLLDKIDNDLPNDEWVKVGMALKDWHPVDGLTLWENWSAGGETWKDGETEKRWRSFDGGSVTLGSIVYMARRSDFEAEKGALDRTLEKIMVADEATLELTLAPKIRKHEFSVLDRNRLAVAFQDRLKTLTGVKPPVGVCREMVADIGGRVTKMAEMNKPEWCKPWVYVNSHKAYVEKESLSVLKAEAFNLENGRHIPADGNGNKGSATKFVADYGLVDRLDTMNYLPMYDDKVVQLPGRSVLNSFNPATVPLAAEHFSPEGLTAIELIKNHLIFICGNKKDAKILLQWLASQVQYPGRQILWSPVIQSIPGVGKSFLGTLMRYCLGVENVGVVKPDQVASQFNGWATNKCVNILEELRVQGHNRYEALNAVKPLITDDIIQINEKNVAPYQTVNTANYICFTNYKDALPLDGLDRRWWVIFAAIERLDQLPDYVGEDASVYFPKLFDAVRNNGAEVRKWMLEYEITEAFKSLKTAPMTDHKELMIATEEAGLEGFQEVREMIAEGGEYFQDGCVSTSDMFAALLFEHLDLDLNTSKRNQIMKKLGYLQVTSPVKIDGKTRRIWVKRKMTNEEIRQKLGKTG